jgi:hypothetical protein
VLNAIDAPSGCDGARARLAVLGGRACWTTFAVACEYFDQPHMIRDFVEFAGISPASYRRYGAGETMFDHLIHAYPRHS